ncbi:MAG: DUF3160 domain-containing protein [Bacillota bacterium]
MTRRHTLLHPVILLLATILVLTSAGLAGCRKAPAQEGSGVPGGTTPGGTGPGATTPTPGATRPSTPPPAFEEPWAKPAEDPGPYVAPTVRATLKPYKVAADLSNVANLDQFGEFDQGQAAALAANGFVISPTAEEQLFYIYENNEYLKLPSLITTDSVLQVYHIFFDYTLRRAEDGFLYPAARSLTTSMLQRLKETYGQIKSPEVVAAAERVTAYFIVGARLLRADIPDGLPGAAMALADSEMKLVSGAAARAPSAIFPFQLDYTQFVPRGHYTRSEELSRYFLGMMWYGQVPFPFKRVGPAGEEPATGSILEASLITYVLSKPDADGKTLIDTWKAIYEPTALLVGEADDLTPVEYKSLLDEVYGAKVRPDSFADPAKVAVFAERGSKLRSPRIVAQLAGIPSGPQLRFMGQRYIPDSEILQKLSTWPERPVPKGLDVAAVLGSARAEGYLAETYKEAENWPNYPVRLKALKEQFSAVSEADWQANIYNGWLWSLTALIPTKGDGFPSFMTSRTWPDKVLNTTLASWAELRHDTILYSKPSGAECGGDGPPKVLGYVEPEVEFYARLGWVTDKLAYGLDQRGYLSDSMRQKFYGFRRLLQFLQDVAVKELAGQPLTDEENFYILVYGGTLEHLTTSVVESDRPWGASHWFEVENETDRNMAVIADVHTSQAECLEVGVGPAYEIYAVVPIEGQLYLARGAVFSYFEFLHPAAQRLTDEGWQKMLKDGQAPPQPDWLRPLIKGKKKTIPLPKETYSSGC